MVQNRRKATSPVRRGSGPAANPSGRRGGQPSKLAGLCVQGHHRTSGQAKLTSDALKNLQKQESMLTGWDTETPSPTPFLRPSSAAGLPPGDTVNITSNTSRTRLSTAPGAAYTGVVVAPSPPAAGNNLGTMVIKTPDDDDLRQRGASPQRKEATDSQTRASTSKSAQSGLESFRPATLTPGKHRPVPMGFLSGKGSGRLFSPLNGRPSLPEAQIAAREANAHMGGSSARRLSPRVSQSSATRSASGSTKVTPRGAPSQEGNIGACSQYSAQSLVNSKTSQLLEELEDRMSELSEDFLEFLERMDRAADADQDGPISLPPEVAASILEIGLKRLTPVDFLLQQFDYNRAFHNAEKKRLAADAAKKELAATGCLDPATGKWVAAPGGSSPTRQRKTQEGGGMSNSERAAHILNLTTKFVETLRSEDKTGPLFEKFQEFRQILRSQVSPTRRGDPEDENPRRRDVSPGKGQHIKYPEFSFAGTAPMLNLHKGQFSAKTETEFTPVEAKFLRDKSSYYPIQPTFRPSPSVMLAADGQGTALPTAYDKITDHPWGAEVRGISPSPHDPGLQSEVVTYRGPAGAYMHRRVRLEPSTLREPDLHEQLMEYDSFVATRKTMQRPESPSEASSISRSPKRHPALLSAADKAGPGARGKTVPNLQLTKQLNVQLGAVTSLFGGLDPFADDWDPSKPIASA